MEHTEKNGLTVGPVTENLYLSLRAVEAARNYYYCAFGDIGREQDGLFNAVQDMLERAIIEAAWIWANTCPETSEI